MRAQAVVRKFVERSTNFWYACLVFERGGNTLIECCHQHKSLYGARDCAKALLKLWTKQEAISRVR